MTAYALTDVVSIDNFPTVQQVTGSVTVEGISLTFPTGSALLVTGSVTLTEPPQRTSNVNFWNISASAASTILLSGTNSRASAIMFNDSPSEAFIAYGPACSYVGNFTYYLSAYMTLEMPQPIYTGILSAVWETATGSMRITEMVY